jgi:hypothetical protein
MRPVALLLAARQAHRRRLEAVLHLVPQRRLAQRTLDDVVHVALDAGDARPEGDVVVDRLRERVGLLEHHADPAPDLDGVDVAVVEVDAVVAHRALDPSRLHQVVHPVEAPQHGGLAAAGRPDERRHLVATDVERHVAHGTEVAVVDAEVVDVEHHLRFLHRGVDVVRVRRDVDDVLVR